MAVDAGAETPRWERLATAGVFVYLVARLVLLAAWIDPALPPDEVTHVGQARSQLHHWGLPVDSPASHEHGLVSHRPFLNTWLLARWLALEPGFANERLWLRLANAAMALGTLGLALAWARRAGASPGARVLLAVVLSNLPMWSFLSASVNYDNLAMLFATLSFVLLARYLDTRQPPLLAGLALSLAAGCLTKSALLPLAALLVAALLMTARGAALRDATALFRAPLAHGRGAALLLIAAVGASAGAGTLYGGNWLRFGALEPAAHQVLPLEAANRNRIFRQEHVLRSYRAGAIDERQAARELQQIDHRGDRAGALWMLRRATELRAGQGEPLMGRVRYAGSWLALMAERLFGVMGHRELYKSGALALAYAAIASAALATLALQLGSLGVHVRVAAGVALGYALILMQLVNYPIYLATGLEVEAVQGRYLFPVLAPLLGSAIIAARGALPRPARLPLGVAVAIFFVAGDFPYFIAQAEPAWWRPS